MRAQLGGILRSHIALPFAEGSAWRIPPDLHAQDLLNFEVHLKCHSRSDSGTR